MPVLTIFAGPNGSGRSSIIRRVNFAGRGNLLEADAIAARIQSGAWTMKAIRQAIARSFFVRLLYICLDSPEQSIQRVHERALPKAATMFPTKMFAAATREVSRILGR